MRAGLGSIKRDDDPLAASQPIILDHVVRAERLKSIVDLLDALHALRAGRRHTSSGHDVLRECLRPLQLRRGLRRAKRWNARGLQRVHRTRHQRHLRANHDKLSVNVFRQLDDRLRRSDVDTPDLSK